MAAPDAMREERKTITTLFADLVGSTALAEVLDPEDVRLVVGEAIMRAGSEVERLGGHVKDIAGDGLLAFFGAPVSYEDDAERALRAGLNITDEIRRFAAEVEQSFDVPGLAVRVGISTGPVVLGTVTAGAKVEYAAFGDTVNSAARIQSHADPGSVLVDAATRRLVESAFEWGDSRELTVKGKTAPVLVNEALGVRVAGARPRGLDGVETPLVGREHELALGERALGLVGAGSGAVVFVTGEAGIGKSRLLHEMRSRFNGRWLEGQCVSYAEQHAYSPFRDLLRNWLELGTDEPELRARLALRRSLTRLAADRSDELYPYLAQLLGIELDSESAQAVGALSPEALQYRTFEVVAEVFERLASNGAIAIVLEDVHWADPTSLQLVTRLLESAERGGLMLVLSQRNEPDHPSWAVKELAAREYHHLTTEIAVAPLAPAEEQALLRVMIGDETLPEALAAQVAAEAEGNPFYLEELVRSLVESGAVVREESGWRFDHEVDVSVPQSVEKVILARLDRLQESTRDVLVAASALGRRFALPLLEGVTGATGLDDALHELQRADLLRAGRRFPAPEFRFKHALIQDAVYGTLLSGERQRLHRAAAEWLEARHADSRDDVASLLAHHWLNSDEPMHAKGYLGFCGDRARQEYALDEAIVCYESMLDLVGDDEPQQQAVVLFKLALALHTALRFEEANAAYQRAFPLWTPPAPVAVAPDVLRIATPYVPKDADPTTAGAWNDIHLGMQLFDRLVEAWPERSIVPSLAERWEISHDGLRYVFHLRRGLRWSDGVPLTAHDVEFGIKRVLGSGVSAAIYFVLENAQRFALGELEDDESVGVRALDDLTVEFRLAAPAPYFMSVMNRPDGAPQPRHAILAHGAAWTAPGSQVVSGPYRVRETAADRILLERQVGYTGSHSGNVQSVELRAEPPSDAVDDLRSGAVDLVAFHYTAHPKCLIPEDAVAELGPAAATAYLSFDHAHPVTGQSDVRLALAHAIDRDGLEALTPANYVVARGGLVPPALQGHTPDIAPRFDRDLATELLGRAHIPPRTRIDIASVPWGIEVAEALAAGWRDLLGLDAAVSAVDQSLVGRGSRATELAPVQLTAWLPGYPDPEYYLRLLLHSASTTNTIGFADAAFDELVERAQRERDGRRRLDLFHQADRRAVTQLAPVVPLFYARASWIRRRSVEGWWEFGKSSASLADIVIRPRA